MHRKALLISHAADIISSITGAVILAPMAAAWLNSVDISPDYAVKERLILIKGCVMKVLSSLKSAKKRDKDCRVVRRKGRVYVINKKNPRFKARQG